jgi:hypothetical protein
VTFVRTPKRLAAPSLLAIALSVGVCTGASGSGTASTWTVAQAGKHAVIGWLDGVDCVTATDCVAVGNETSATGPTDPLVDTLNHGSWSAAAAPLARGSQGDYLFSVSCPRSGSCVAVGYYFTPVGSGGKGTIFIEALANGRWSVTATPSLGSNVRDSFLYGVSCTTPSTCVAVGNTDNGDSSTNRPLILTMVNGSWTVSRSQSLKAQSGGLLAVSCANSATCVASGYEGTSSSNKTVVETRIGNSWSVTPSPGSGGSNPNYGAIGLTGLSCVSATACTAVGQLTGPGPIVETTTNGRWSIASSPAPNSKDSATGLYSVSCTARTTCAAVGEVAQQFGSNAPDGAFGDPVGTLIEIDAGGSWAVAANPNGLPPDSGLHAVSCVAQTCVAVGQSGQAGASGPPTTKTLIVQTT